MIGLLCSAAIAGEDSVCYARCNLKVIKGNSITWINWQASPEFLPVGTKFNIRSTGSKIILIGVDTGLEYALDAGAKGEKFVE